MQVAREIREGMSRRLVCCNLFKLQEIQPEDLNKYDLIGLGSPAWNGRPSPNMDRFIARFSSLEGKHAFFFFTHGAIPGSILSNIVPDLRRKGLIVIGWANWYGSVTLPVMPKPYYTDGHPDLIDLEEAGKFGIRMAENSIKISKGNLDLIPELLEGKEYEKVYGKLEPRSYPDEFLEVRNRSFKIDPEKCIRCGLCAENCPTDNIDFSDRFPVFKITKCRRCWYCEQICPTGAIFFDWDAFYETMRKYSQSGADDRLEILAEAERRGYFRRLVPIESVDENRPWYKISNHPRIKMP